MSLRINVYISSSGYCSRREADRLIDAGRVRINDQIASTGMDVSESDIVKVDNQIVKPKKTTVYLLYHKPKGIVCTTDQSIKHNIIDAIQYPERIFPVGRLDKDTSGIIILTSDGQIVNRILRSENNHEKEYIVSTRRPIDDEFVSNMSSGVTIYNPVRHTKQKTKPCKVVQLAENKFSIILTQGLNLQIRRTTQALGNEVIELLRIRIMNLSIDGLKIGQWREIQREELQKLMFLIENVSQ